MAGAYQYIGHVFSMLVLLVCSAFFSGVETAFFNLSRRQIAQLKKSAHKLQNLAAKMLDKPKQLLGALLLGNMMVNVLFFAITSVLTIRIEQHYSAAAAAIVAIVSFCLLILLGEIVPKSLAYANSMPISITAALPLFLWLRVSAPLQSILRILVVEPALRLILGSVKRPKPVSTDEFRALIQQISNRGLISPDENKLLGEIVELGFLKVRHAMKPRVDMIACDVTASSEYARNLMQQNNLTKVPVYVKKIDNIIGLVHLRRILLNPDAQLDKLVQEIHFVPEQKTVESLLEFFRKSQSDTAIVVDEYGGIAGSITLEDIVEELLGPIEHTGEIKPIEKIGPFEYRLAGDLPIHDWADVFGIELAETRFATIAGLVATILGKIPKTGDIAHLENLKFTIERVRKNRIETLILTLEPIKTDD